LATGGFVSARLSVRSAWSSLTEVIAVSSARWSSRGSLDSSLASSSDIIKLWSLDAVS